MNQPSNQPAADDAGNLVDRAAGSADRLLDATRQTAASAIDSVADTVHALRDKASPALDRVSAPLNAVVKRTQESPLQSLLIAAAVGAAVLVVARWFRPSRSGDRVSRRSRY